jgi:RNA polymerase sigma factor (TIGR02999 family)
VTPSTKSISQLLIEWREGDEAALAELMPLVYEELRRIARRYMRGERVGHTLQTTALANELYLRLVDEKGMRWQNRLHFYAVCALAMRRILVDHARKHNAQKRKVEFVDLAEAALIPAEERSAKVVAVDEVLTELETIDPRKANIVVCKYFGGMTDKETAEALDISTATVSREWKIAKLWLLEALSRRA